MTEEQNKLAERLDDLRRNHAGMLPAEVAGALSEAVAALREPATEAVLEEAAKICERAADSRTHTFAAEVARMIRALKGKGASQGDKTADTAENFPDGGWHD